MTNEEPRIVKMESFLVAGLTYRGKNEHGEVPRLWDEQFLPRLGELAAVRVGGEAYGVIGMPPDAEPMEMEYLAGVRVAGPEGVPDDMAIWQVPEMTCAVFTAHNVPDLPRVFDYYYQEWQPNSEIWEQGDGPQLEVYPATFAQDGLIEVRFPVQRANALPTGSLVSGMRVQTIQGFTFFYMAERCAYSEINPTIHALAERVNEAQRAGGVATYGPGVLVYRATEDPNETIIELGGMAAPGAQAAGGAQVREFGPFRCATVLYTGPFSEMRAAYDALYGGLERAGLKPSGEHREFLLYEERDDSPNNIVLLQAGLAEGE